MVFAATRHPLLLCYTQLCKRLVHWQMMRTPKVRFVSPNCKQKTLQSILEYVQQWMRIWMSCCWDRQVHRTNTSDLWTGLDYVVWLWYANNAKYSDYCHKSTSTSSSSRETLTRDVFLPVSEQLFLLLRRSQLVNSTRTITTTSVPEGVWVEGRFQFSKLSCRVPWWIIEVDILNLLILVCGSHHTVILLLGVALSTSACWCW